MKKENIKVIAMDLDGTLTQHKQHMEPRTKQTLEALSKKYKLLMVGAGQVYRIFNQMEHFPIDIIGNYGLQFATFNPETGDLDIRRDLTFPCDRPSVEERVTFLRNKHGYTEFAGENVEYHPSGCLGGSSSFDMAPKPYNKYHALDLYCQEYGLSHENVVFVGDDYGPGGNDESVYLSDIPFICIDDYRTFPDKVSHLL